jgi:sec-independent protein translocase protein TatA
MPGLGWQELVIVLIIVIIIFGAGKLPEIGGAMGKSIKEFKKASDDDTPSVISTTSSASTTHATTSAETQRSNTSVTPTTSVRADDI